MDFELLNIIIQLIVMAVLLFGVWAIRKWQLEKYVTWAVYAYEAIIKGTKLGEVRKEAVIDFITKKFKISREELSIIIDGIVEQMNIQKGKAPKLE